MASASASLADGLLLGVPHRRNHHVGSDIDVVGFRIGYYVDDLRRCDDHFHFRDDLDSGSSGRNILGNIVRRAA